MRKKVRKARIQQHIANSDTFFFNFEFGGGFTRGNADYLDFTKPWLSSTVYIVQMSKCQTHLA